MSLGERIQQLRKTRGLSQEQLADSLNVSRQAISKWETDQSSPEIENILALSSVFSVTTDELLGNDIEGINRAQVQRSEADTETKAEKKKFSVAAYTIKKLKPAFNSKVMFLVFTISCLVAVGTCVIVNYAIDQQITWAAYPILSVPVGWLIVTPAIFRKLLLSQCMFTLSAIPFLFFLERITPATDWFIALGLPAAVAGILFIWLDYLLFRYIKINIWFKVSITILLCGVLDNLVINHFVDLYHSTTTPFLQYFISSFSYAIVVIVFLILGWIKSRPKHADSMLKEKELNG